MPQPEDGGVNDEELKMALQVPLPVDQEAMQSEDLEQAVKIPLPNDDEILKEVKEEI